jgi:hypothetical protein
MTKARRISLGERTRTSQLVHDPDNPQVIDTSEAKVGEPREVPERLCKRCEGAAEGTDDTAYALLISGTGLGHYDGGDGTTLCGLDTADLTPA